jgi:hypothetical protein
MTSAFPRMMRVRQNFPSMPKVDLKEALTVEFCNIQGRIKLGAKVAVGVGSRGISNLPNIVREVLGQLKRVGAEPFIIPAMGSHGGATPEGQLGILESLGITESTMGVPIRASLETREIGKADDGLPVHCSNEAMSADGIILINRIKPHTDFSGSLGSGLIKMSVIGLGKRSGAAAMHAAASRLGHERVIRQMAQVILRKAPILGGVAILENQAHDTAKILVLPREEIEIAEEGLLIEARKLMPSLPFEEIDLLVLDQIGKNISGSGMDPNVTGRWVQGYSSSLAREGRAAPFIRRIFVRNLTRETHGNAIGIGLADGTTKLLVQAIDHRITNLNALTALTPQCAKIPVYFETDREGLDYMLTSLGLPDTRTARFVRARDTLSLANLEISESLLEEAKKNVNVTFVGGPNELQFDKAGNLLPLEVAV